MKFPISNQLGVRVCVGGSCGEVLEVSAEGETDIPLTPKDHLC